MGLEYDYSINNNYDPIMSAPTKLEIIDHAINDLKHRIHRNHRALGGVSHYFLCHRLEFATTELYRAHHRNECIGMITELLDGIRYFATDMGTNSLPYWWGIHGCNFGAARLELLTRYRAHVVNELSKEDVSWNQI